LIVVITNGSTDKIQALDFFNVSPSKTH
jgi:hypothetical protein